MANDITDLDIDDDVLEDEALPANLRAAAKRGRDAIREAAQARREMLFMRVGLDPKAGDKRTQMLIRSLMENTALDDEAKVRAEALELGLIEPPPTAPSEAQVDAAEQAAARQGLGNGAAPTPANPAEQGEHPMTRALVGYHADMKAGHSNPDEAGQKALATLVRAHAEGDQRVMFNQERWLAKAREIEGSEAPVAS